MNRWTELSIEYANQRSYLDDLFHVYPTIPEGIRDIDKEIWANVEKAFTRRHNETLIKELLKLDLFPIKDSYVAYLKRDSSAIGIVEDFTKWGLIRYLKGQANQRKQIVRLARCFGSG